ncbi:MAG: hypothetical protein ACI31M_04690 [Bacilli bacterium]
MKCLKCGSVNKKTNEKCKKCGESLYNIESLKEEKEIEVETKVENIIPKEKKKYTFFRKLWRFIKIIIAILILAIIGLTIYVYNFYDYSKYFVDNMNQYYETETDKYLENIKLVFRIYSHDDDKMDELEDDSKKVVKEWIEEIKDKDFKVEEEYINSLKYLQDVIDELYENTEVEGYRAINKKDYISLNYEVKKLLEDKKAEEKEENKIEKDEENNEYDLSFVTEVDLRGALKLFDLDKTSVLYIGREDCSACNYYVPNLYRANNNYNNLTIYYLDLNKVDRNSKYFEKLIEKLDKEYIMTLDGEAISKSFGEWFGYTPMTLIIEKDELVDGVIGAIIL